MTRILLVGCISGSTIVLGIIIPRIMREYLFERSTRCVGAVYLLLAVLLHYSQPAYSQQVELTKFGVSNGLPSSYIFHVAQCQHGYLWIATDRGVCRFDGSRFDHILDTVMVYRVLEGRHGKVWLCTFEHGLILIDAVTLNVLQTYMPKSAQSVYDVDDDGFGRLLVRTYGGLEIIENGKSVVIGDTINQTPNNHLVKLGGGRYLFRANGQINMIEAHQHGFAIKPAVSEGSIVEHFYANTSIYFVGHGFGAAGAAGGYILTKNFVDKLELQDSTLILKKHYKLQNATSIGKWGNLLVVGTSDRGLQVLESSTVESIEMPSDLSSSYITSVHSDTYGQLWVGTFGDGLYRLSRANWRVRSEVGGVVNAVGIDGDGGIYAGTPTGLHVITKTSHYFSRNEPEYLRNIRSICIDASGKFYVGTFLALVGPATIEQYYSKQADVFFHGNGVSGIIPNPDGEVWISTYGSGICLAKMGSSNVEVVDSLPTQMVNKLFKTSGAMWATTDKGLLRIENGSVKHFTQKTGLLESSVSYVFGSSADSIIIGCSKGIQVYSSDAGTFSSHTKGFVGNRVVKIFKDRLKRILVLSNTHLHIFSNRGLVALKSFQVLPNSSYHINDAAYNCNTNELVLATSNGVVVLNLQEAFPQKHTPLLYIDAIKSDTLIATNQRGTLALKLSGNSLYLKVGVQYLPDNQNVTWSYWFEGVDGGWSEPTSNFELAYPKLPYGAVKLWAKAFNPDGVEGETQLLLSTHIRAPLHLRWYSILVELLVAIAALVASVKYFTLQKVKKQIREMEVQQKIQTERQRIARDLHDNVGSQLTYIITNLEQLSDSGVEKAHELSTFGRNAIGQLRETIWAINSDFTEIDDFVDAIRKVCFQYLKGSGIDYTLVSKINRSIRLTPTQTLGLFRIIQEAITNIIKHSGASHVMVEFSEATGLCVLITDNGTGYNVASSGGYGIKNMNHRAAEIGASIGIATDENGTRVEITLELA